MSRFHICSAWESSSEIPEEVWVREAIAWSSLDSQSSDYLGLETILPPHVLLWHLCTSLPPSQGPCKKGG